MGFGCEYMLLLKRTANSSLLNYPGNLGRTCRRQIRHTANARTETFKKESRQSRKVSIVLLAAVGGGRSHCIAVERVRGFSVILAFALQGLAHFLICYLSHPQRLALQTVHFFMIYNTYTRYHKVAHPISKVLQ